MSSSFAQLVIGAADRAADAIKAEVWRDVNAVGRWLAILDNTGGTYNGVFDVQDQFLIDVNAIGTTLMQGRVDSSPSVSLAGVDDLDIFRELVAIRGVDQMQDFMFHNDLDQFYPDTAQLLRDVLNEVSNGVTVSIRVQRGFNASPHHHISHIERIIIVTEKAETADNPTVRLLPTHRDLRIRS